MLTKFGGDINSILKLIFAKFNLKINISLNLNNRNISSKRKV